MYNCLFLNYKGEHHDVANFCHRFFCNCNQHNVSMSFEMKAIQKNKKSFNWIHRLNDYTLNHPEFQQIGMYF